MGKVLTLYMTAEPCMMCVGGILCSGIERVVFGAPAESVERTAGFDESFKPSWREEFARRSIAVVGSLLPGIGEAVLAAYIKRSGVVYSPERSSEGLMR